MRRRPLPPAQAERRRPGNSGAFVVLYVGLLLLLIIEQFVVHVPPIGYLDVALLFAVVNVVLAFDRARAGLRASGTLGGAVLGVLPVALVSTVVGVAIVVAAGSEPTVVAVVGGGLVFLALFVGATAGGQFVSQRRRAAADRRSRSAEADDGGRPRP